MDDLLVSREVASLCRVSAPTVRWWRQQGVGPPSFNLNGRVVYRRRSVLIWIAAQEKLAQPPERELAT